MDYYGLLFLYYLKGLSGKSVLRLFFNIEAGGTEQLLPENTSTPTTTPILADIQYPDGLRTDQYFTYRETPTTVSNKARIKTIKGNTLNWNQLVQNGNFADSSFWSGQSTTVSISNGVANVTLSAKGNYVALRQSPLSSVTGHKYFVTATFKCTKKTAIGFYLNGQSVYLDGYDVQANTLTKVSALINSGESGGFNVYVSRKNELDVGDVVQVSNVMLIDLTQMGLDITDPSEFISLFPLSYYDFNQGSLLSFNGNGIKTVGKNLLNLNVQAEDVTIAGIRYVHNSDGTISVSGTATGTSTYRIYSSANASRFSGMYLQGNPVNDNTVAMVGIQENGGTWASYGYDYGLGVKLKDIPEGTNVWMFIRIFQGKTVNAVFKPMICFNNNETFEPYTSFTLSLPISTYFPSGMKSAGNVYDELTESKAITRIGNVTFDGTQTVAGSNFSSTQCRMFINVPNVKPFTPFTSGDVDNGIISSYLQNTSNDATFNGAKGIHRRINGASQICVSLGTDGYASGITTETLFNQYLASHPLTVYYELETPTETPITTEDANEALSLLMGKSVSSDNANQLINIITKGE